MTETILKCKFGSHLYGTNTEDSDEDYKGIALPDSSDILLGNIFKTKKESTGNDRSKNTKDDLDYDIYSMHYFIELACKGETSVIDMLHVPENMILQTSPEWKFIQAHREEFYTKNMSAFVGYARRQAAKYGCKGSRLDAIKGLIRMLGHSHPDDEKMLLLWEGVLDYDSEHGYSIEDSPNGAKQYQVCGKIIQSTAGINYTRLFLQNFYDSFGERAKQAELNKGIDWKAISHAIRAAEQLIELFIMNTITFPRPEADYLKAVKSGKLDYRKEVEPYLNDVMDRVERLGSASRLPDKVDINFWNNFLIETCKKQIINF